MKIIRTRNVAPSLWATLLAVSLLLMVSIAASAQTFTATLTGTITDQNGGALPGAKVVVTNQGTKLEYTATTTDAGIYTLPFLPVGNYVITVEASGFKKLASNEIKLEINQTARVNLAMQVGGVNDTVTITDAAPILQTETTTVGGVISGNTTTSLTAEWTELSTTRPCSFPARLRQIRVAFSLAQDKVEVAGRMSTATANRAIRFCWTVFP